MVWQLALALFVMVHELMHPRFERILLIKFLTSSNEYNAGAWALTPNLYFLMHPVLASRRNVAGERPMTSWIRLALSSSGHGWTSAERQGSPLDDTSISIAGERTADWLLATWLRASVPRDRLPASKMAVLCPMLSQHAHLPYSGSMAETGWSWNQSAATLLSHRLSHLDLLLANPAGQVDIR